LTLLTALFYWDNIDISAQIKTTHLVSICAMTNSIRKVCQGRNPAKRHQVQNLLQMPTFQGCSGAIPKASSGAVQKAATPRARNNPGYPHGGSPQ
jgi:hypothetical protein